MHTHSQREKLVSLDTGETTFWRAFDQFCDKAGLRERETNLSDPALLGRYGRLDGTSNTILYGTPEGQKSIRLCDGKPEKVPTFVHGGLRIRALPLDSQEAMGAIAASPPWPSAGRPPQRLTGFKLEVTPEPNHSWQGVIRMAIDKAVDDKGQVLKQLEPYRVPDAEEVWHDLVVVWDATTGLPMVRNFRRHIPALLTPGAKDAKLLKEVHGTLTAEVQALQPIATIDDILQAAGKTVKGTTGGELKIVEVSQQGTRLRVRIELQAQGQLGGMPALRAVRGRPGGVIELRGSPANRDISLSLFDRDGKPLPLLSLNQTNLLIGRGKRGMGGLNLEYEAEFALTPGQAKPDRLVYSAPKNVIVTLPFTLRDVPLSAVVRTSETQPAGKRPE